MSQFIGVDLGGTRIRSALVDAHLTIQERHETFTLADQGLDATLERIKTMIRTALPKDDSPIEGIGISAPGPLNPETGIVVAPPNLAGWHNVPLGDILHEEFGVPVFVGNDANVAALAETAVGASKGYRYAIYITISTGIGSGIVNGGRLITGKSGLGAEAGHIPLLLEAGRVSTLEKEAAGPALARRARRLLADGTESSIRTLCGDNLDLINAEMIAAAAAAEDPLAMDIVKYCGMCVGLGCVTMLHLFNPEIIVIGGGVSNIGSSLFAEIEATVRQYSLDEAYWRDLRIVPAGLGGDVSIIGAAALVLTQGGQKDVSQLTDLLNS